MHEEGPRCCWLGDAVLASTQHACCCWSHALSLRRTSYVLFLMLVQVTRLERSRRYMLKTTRPLTEAEKLAFAALVHDRMTEEVRMGCAWSHTLCISSKASEC